MKRISFAIVALAAAAIGGTADAQSLPIQGWYGNYHYSESLGRDALGQGITISVEHDLTIGRNGCRLHAEGYQTDTTIRCIATPRGDRLQVTFLSYGDGSLLNVYGNRIYSVGQVLFTLSRDSGGMVTTWGAYAPTDRKAPPARYFVRQ